MKVFNIFLLIVLISILPSCQPDPSTIPPSQNIVQEETSMLFFLFFKKEKKLELWKSDKDFDTKLIASYPILECRQTPIGIFNTSYSTDENIQIEFPNQFYFKKASIKNEIQKNKILINSEFTGQDDKQSILVTKQTLAMIKDALETELKTRVFVFPNDTRQGGTFEPCFGCPHYMGELYSSLELHLEKFKM